MDPAVKKVSIAIIVILLLTIGGFWYANNPITLSHAVKNSTETSTRTPNPEAIINIQTYTAGRDQIDKAISAELAKTGTTSSRTIQTAKQYTTTNLVISYDTSAVALHAYGIKVASALKPLGNDTGNPIAVMLNILQTGDQSQVQTIIARATASKQALADLLKIPTPKTAAAIHLALINAVASNGASLRDMATILDYPSIAIQSADLYRVQSLDFVKAVNRLNQFFRDNNVVFSDNENGTIYAN